MTIKLFDAVVSKVGITSMGVHIGSIGAVVDIYPDGVYEVDFEDDSAEQRLIVVAMRAEQLTHAPA